MLSEASGDVGAKLLSNAFELAAKRGYRSCHLDVASDLSAAQFYLRMGMKILAESRIPELDEKHGVAMHYRMLKRLDWRQTGGCWERSVMTVFVLGNQV